MAAKPTVWLTVATIGAVLLAGCTGGRGAGGRPPAPLPGVALPGPEGGLKQPVWLADGWVYFVRLTPDFSPELEVWRTKAAGPAERVNLPGEPGCRLTRWNALHRLPDGRLGLVRRCLLEEAGKDWHDVVAFTPATGKLETMAELDDTVVSNLTWAPDLRSGFISHTTGICAAIAPLTSKGAARFPSPVEIDGKSWRLDNGVFKSATESCAGDGRADRPVLLPDGKTLILAASPASQGSEGQTRIDKPWNIYRWVPGEGNPRRLAEGFGDPLGLEITPNGKWAILASSNGGKQGVWGIDVQTGRSHMLAEGNPKGVSVSPDGKQAVVSFEPDTGDLRHDMVHLELRVIDLSGL